MYTEPEPQLSLPTYASLSIEIIVSLYSVYSSLICINYFTAPSIGKAIGITLFSRTENVLSTSYYLRLLTCVIPLSYELLIILYSYIYSNDYRYVMIFIRIVVIGVVVVISRIILARKLSWIRCTLKTCYPEVVISVTYSLCFLLLTNTTAHNEYPYNVALPALLVLSLVTSATFIFITFFDIPPEEYEIVDLESPEIQPNSRVNIDIQQSEVKMGEDGQYIAEEAKHEIIMLEPDGGSSRYEGEGQHSVQMGPGRARIKLDDSISSESADGIPIGDSEGYSRLPPSNSYSISLDEQPGLPKTQSFPSIAEPSMSRIITLEESKDDTEGRTREGRGNSFQQEGLSMSSHRSEEKVDRKYCRGEGETDEGNTITSMKVNRGKYKNEKKSDRTVRFEARDSHHSRGVPLHVDTPSSPSSSRVSNRSGGTSRKARDEAQKEQLLETTVNERRYLCISLLILYVLLLPLEILIIISSIKFPLEVSTICLCLYQFLMKWMFKSTRRELEAKMIASSIEYDGDSLKRSRTISSSQSVSPRSRGVSGSFGDTGRARNTSNAVNRKRYTEGITGGNLVELARMSREESEHKHSSRGKGRLYASSRDHGDVIDVDE